VSDDSDYLKGLGIKTLILLFALVVMLVGLPILAVSDTSASLTYGAITGNKITTSQTEVSNSSASATITITMYTVADE
jgi:hypothetical protein